MWELQKEKGEESAGFVASGFLQPTFYKELEATLLRETAHNGVRTQEGKASLLLVQSC